MNKSRKQIQTVFSKSVTWIGPNRKLFGSTLPEVKFEGDLLGNGLGVGSRNLHGICLGFRAECQVSESHLSTKLIYN